LIKNNISKNAANVNIVELDISTLEDGVYQGEYTLSPVTVLVEVKVVDHQIDEIIILKHDNMFGKKAEVITEKIVDEQSLDVELISGATVSSKTILKAIEIALGGNE